MIKIYTTPTCPYCVTLMGWLKSKNVEFEEIDIAEDEKAREDIIERSGQIGVPVIDVDGKIIVGFDRNKIAEILKI